MTKNNFDSVPMSAIEREFRLVQAALGDTQDESVYSRLYAAQQALAWALDPNQFASPYGAITDTLEGSGDCLAPPHHSPF